VREQHILQRRRLRYGLLFALWTLLGVIDASQYYVIANFFGRGKPVTWDIALASGLADWYGWAVLSFGIAWVARRFPFGVPGWRLSLVAHLVFGATCVVVKTANDLMLAWAIHGPDVIKDGIGRSFLFYLTVKSVSGAVIYLAIVGFCHGIEYYNKFRERELRASQLEASLVRAQLQVLKMQLHPHFLFNTLHAVSALMHKDVAVADRMLARLGELLRVTLEHVGTHEATLRKELDFLRPYLEIEQARLGQRLRVSVEVDPEVMDALLPYLVLQPLVENAIRYGVAARNETGRVVVRAERVGTTLKVQVLDDGPGLPPGGGREGIGLSNTRARLRGLYGEAQTMTLHNRPTGGLEVTLTLPYREADEVVDSSGEVMPVRRAAVGLVG
jgi:two-component system, LytTR family, sensor kinase